ncbi:MAG: acyl carrier protein [Cyanobacteria bacterium P01_C01_bin.72]
MEIQSSQREEMFNISQISNNHSQENIPQKTATAEEIQTWTVSYLAELLEIKPDEIDVTIPFDRYGLDSSAAVGMTGDLEEWLGYELDPTLIYDYPTIKSLAVHLSK